MTEIGRYSFSFSAHQLNFPTKGVKKPQLPPFQYCHHKGYMWIARHFPPLFVSLVDMSAHASTQNIRGQCSALNSSSEILIGIALNPIMYYSQLFVPPFPYLDYILERIIPCQGDRCWNVQFSEKQVILNLFHSLHHPVSSFASFQLQRSFPGRWLSS